MLLYNDNWKGVKYVKFLIISLIILFVGGTIYMVNKKMVCQH